MDLDSTGELCLTNYTAVSFLERLGIAPNPEQINTTEFMVLMACYPKKMTPQIIKQCVGNDKLTSLFLYLRIKLCASKGTWQKSRSCV